MNKKTEVTISRTIKIPIPGVQFSNEVFSATIVYDGENFNLAEAVQELDKVLAEVKDKDTAEFLKQTPQDYRKRFEKGGEQ